MKDKSYDVRYLDILHEILAGKNTATKLSKALSLPYSTISDRLGKMVKEEFIYKDVAFNTRPYRLTKKGKNAITDFLSTLTAQNHGKSRIRAHKVCWYFDIVRAPYDLRKQLGKNSFSVSIHNTWPKYSRKLYEDAQIVFNPNKVYVYTEEFYLDSPMEYYEKAMTRLEEIRKDLQDRFTGLVLGSPDKKMVTESNHLARVHGPLAMKFYKDSIKKGEKIAYHGKNLHVDFSDGPPEEETVDKRKAPAHLDELGQFFDDFLDDPMPWKEVHAVRERNDQVVHDVQELQVRSNEVKARTKKTDSQLKYLKKSVSDGKTRTAKLESELVNLQGLAAEQTKLSIETNKTAINIKEDLHAMHGVVQELSNLGIQTNQQMMVMNETMGVFQTAMAEHLGLISALKDVAVTTKEGMDNQAAVLATALQQIAEAQKPWYKKAWEKLKQFKGGRLAENGRKL